LPAQTQHPRKVECASRLGAIAVKKKSNSLWQTNLFLGILFKTHTFVCPSPEKRSLVSTLSDNPHKKAKTENKNKKRTEKYEKATEQIAP
jgi:hypothetical protein